MKVFALIILMFPTLLFAKVYKCGSSAGVNYSAKPCKSGKEDKDFKLKTDKLPRYTYKAPSNAFIASDAVRRYRRNEQINKQKKAAKKARDSMILERYRLEMRQDRMHDEFIDAIKAPLVIRRR